MKGIFERDNFQSLLCIHYKPETSICIGRGGSIQKKIASLTFTMSLEKFVNMGRGRNWDLHPVLVKLLVVSVAIGVDGRL